MEGGLAPLLLVWHGTSMRAGEQASMQQWQLKDRISALESDGGMGPLSPKALRWAQELQEAAAEAEQLCSERLAQTA